MLGLHTARKWGLNAPRYILATRVNKRLTSAPNMNTDVILYNLKRRENMSLSGIYGCLSWNNCLLFSSRKYPYPRWLLCKKDRGTCCTSWGLKTWNWYLSGVKWSLRAMAHPAGAYPGFRSMKRLGVFLLLLDRILVHRRSLPSNLLGFPNKSPVPIYTPG